MTWLLISTLLVQCSVVALRYQSTTYLILILIHFHIHPHLHLHLHLAIPFHSIMSDGGDDDMDWLTSLGALAEPSPAPTPTVATTTSSKPTSNGRLNQHIKFEQEEKEEIKQDKKFIIETKA